VHCCKLLELLKDLAKQKKIGAEMFEADNQNPLDQYVRGEINQKNWIHWYDFGRITLQIINHL
jgi:uncharacterized iron-regulated protein